MYKYVHTCKYNTYITLTYKYIHIPSKYIYIHISKYIFMYIHVYIQLSYVWI